MKKLVSVMSFLLPFIFCLPLASQMNQNPQNDELQVVTPIQVVDANTPTYQEIGIESVVHLLAAESSFVLVDARYQKFDDGKRIPGGIFLSADAKIEQISFHLPDKETKIIVYSSNMRCPASAALADRLVKLGYAHVSRYAGGLNEWKSNGQELETVSLTQNDRPIVKKLSAVDYKRSHLGRGPR